jgi:hypothetical protein
VLFVRTHACAAVEDGDGGGLGACVSNHLFDFARRLQVLRKRHPCVEASMALCGGHNAEANQGSAGYKPWKPPENPSTCDPCSW